jgi:hypothetical protein
VGNVRTTLLYILKENTMLVISIPNHEVNNLDLGVPVRINGTETILTRDGDYLCYEGKRCKIIDESPCGDLVSFAAASDGMEHEPHAVIRPNL